MSRLDLRGYSEGKGDLVSFGVCKAKGRQTQQGKGVARTLSPGYGFTRRKASGRRVGSAPPPRMHPPLRTGAEVCETSVRHKSAQKVIGADERPRGSGGRRCAGRRTRGRETRRRSGHCASRWLDPSASRARQTMAATSRGLTTVVLRNLRSRPLLLLLRRLRLRRIRRIRHRIYHHIIAHETSRRRLRRLRPSVRSPWLAACPS